ncbi:zinc finger and BTB domain-containing protein 38 [Protopterus annectens]|uniref:zinc finger and BTB domain-containing protein 38 n=1 Tax=Protopterus annectens TaxID=7888 RepID=UPI001CFBB91E|nr:zinc finger and BTB domain-containing protein 38 [Protopterus annectens]XP_043926993.1 zinc finger and BTB domain-containing protein 38 [Protopterus annectens]
MAVRSLSTEVTDSSHSQTVLHSLNEQRCQGIFCDVIIIVEDKKFKAHKNVLAACSLYFKKALSTDDLRISSDVLELPDFKAELFEEVLDFIYSSKAVTKGTGKVRDLIGAGRRLGIPFLETLTDVTENDTQLKNQCSYFASAVHIHPQEKNESSITPQNLKLESSATSERQGVESLFSYGPRIANAFSVVETESKPNLFSTLDQTANAENTLVSTSTSDSMTITVSRKEHAQAFADHSYAVSSSSFEMTKSSECCDVLLPDVSIKNDDASLKTKQAFCMPERLHEQQSSACLVDERSPAAAGINNQMNLDLKNDTFYVPNPSIATNAFTVHNTDSDKDETSLVNSSTSFTPVVQVPSTFSCDHCLKSFSSLDLLNIHIQLHKKCENVRACRFCSKKFIRLKKLEIHEQFCRLPETSGSAQKTGDTQDQSSDLGSSCSKNPSSNSLPFTEVNSSSYEILGPGRSEGSQQEDPSVRVIDGKMFYICTVCKRTYVTQSSLKRHSNVHFWRREYPCHYCSKVFALAEYRTKHELWHTGERRYQCIFCLETFMTYYILKNHQKSFHGIDPRLTANKRTTSGGFKPSVYPYKLYRLLPMKFRRRSFNECSNPVSVTLDECGQHEKLSSDLCPAPNYSVSSFDCPVSTYPSEITVNAPMQQPLNTESLSLSNQESDIAFEAGDSGEDFSDEYQSCFSSNKNTLPSVAGDSNVTLNSCNPPSLLPVNVSSSTPSVVSCSYPAPSVIMHSSRISSVIMQGNALCSTVNSKEQCSSTVDNLLPQGERNVSKKDCVKDLDVPESSRSSSESGKSSGQFQNDHCTRQRIETYIAKPALPDTTENRSVAPLCRITVRIGSEAIVRRQISGSALYKKHKKSNHSGTVGESTEVSLQTEGDDDGTTDSFLDTDPIRDGEPYDDISDHDSTDKPWRPYCSYKSRKKHKGLKKKKWKHKYRYTNTYKHTITNNCSHDIQQIHENEVVDKTDKLTSVFSDKNMYALERVKLHLKQHSAVSLHCELCQKDFLNKSTLKSHMRCHTGEQPYACKTCGRCFSMSGNLHKHERIHLGIKEFVCQVCNKAFTLSETLKKHERIHTGEKRYSCSFCFQRFLYLSTKKSHERKHLNVKKGSKFLCSYCSKVCKTAAALAVHQKMHFVGSISQSSEEFNSGNSEDAMLGSQVSYHDDSVICNPAVSEHIFIPASNTQESFEVSQREIKTENHLDSLCTSALKDAACRSPKYEGKLASNFVSNDALKLPQQHNSDSCQVYQYDLKENKMPFQDISCKQEITNCVKKESTMAAPQECYYQTVNELVYEENFQQASSAYEIVPFQRTLLCKYSFRDGHMSSDNLLQERTIINTAEANSC